MALNKSNGNMYEWVTHTWNTVKGACPHNCSYCYMKRWGQQREIRFDVKELKTNLGSGNFIFVGSSNDMFADDIPGMWIDDTMRHCAEYYNNRYLFQSKNPIRMLDYIHASMDAVVCTTIETNRWYPEIMRNAPTPNDRAAGIRALPFRKYVTIEPIIDFDMDEMIALIRLCDPAQVNIGADSGNNHLPEPSISKIVELVDALNEFTVVAKKRNLNRLAYR